MVAAEQLEAPARTLADALEVVRWQRDGVGISGARGPRWAVELVAAEVARRAAGFEPAMRATVAAHRAAYGLAPLANGAPQSPGLARVAPRESPARAPEAPPAGDGPPELFASAPGSVARPQRDASALRVPPAHAPARSFEEYGRCCWCGGALPHHQCGGCDLCCAARAKVSRALDAE